MLIHRHKWSYQDWVINWLWSLELYHPGLGAWIPGQPRAWQLSTLSRFKVDAAVAVKLGYEPRRTWCFVIGESKGRAQVSGVHKLTTLEAWYVHTIYSVQDKRSQDECTYNLCVR